jgi:hypothetical protein
MDLDNPDPIPRDIEEIELDDRDYGLARQAQVVRADPRNRTKDMA